MFTNLQNKTQIRFGLGDLLTLLRWVGGQSKGRQVNQNVTIPSALTQ